MRCAIIKVTPMSKQDAVAPGLRVHLHQQGFVWGLKGVLNLTGLKQPVPRCEYKEGFGGVLILRGKILPLFFLRTLCL